MYSLLFHSKKLGEIILLLSSPLNVTCFLIWTVSNKYLISLFLLLVNEPHVLLLPSSLKICLIFPFPSVPKNLSYFTFTIFGSGLHIPLTRLHSHFIIKLIYKSSTHNPLTFFNSLSITFLKIRVGSKWDKFWRTR